MSPDVPQTAKAVFALCSRDFSRRDSYRTRPRETPALFRTAKAICRAQVNVRGLIPAIEQADVYNGNAPDAAQLGAGAQVRVCLNAIRGSSQRWRCSV